MARLLGLRERRRGETLDEIQLLDEDQARIADRAALLLGRGGSKVAFHMRSCGHHGSLDAGSDRLTLLRAECVCEPLSSSGDRTKRR